MIHFNSPYVFLLSCQYYEKQIHSFIPNYFICMLNILLKWDFNNKNKTQTCSIYRCVANFVDRLSTSIPKCWVFYHRPLVCMLHSKIDKCIVLKQNILYQTILYDLDVNFSIYQEKEIFLTLHLQLVV